MYSRQEVNEPLSNWHNAVLGTQIGQSRVSFRPNVTLRHTLVRTKEGIPINKTTGVVYQVPCASYPATYVGQTGRRLDQRLREHCRAIDSGDCANSALAEHAWGHPVDQSNTKVLNHHLNMHQRLVLESVHIPV